MYSPQDRVYTTPECTTSAAHVTLQRLRLESILRRAGFFSCCKSYWQPDTTLPVLQQPRITTSLEPFGEKQDVKGRDLTQHNRTTKSKDIKNSRPTLPSIKPKTQPTKNRHAHCVTTEKPAPDSYLGGVSKPRRTTKPVYESTKEIYRPFCPQKPVRLPSIPKEGTEIKKTKTKTKTDTTNGCIMCAELKRQTKMNNGTWQQSQGDLNQKRRRKKEQQFRQWSESQDNYYGKPLDFDMYDARLFETQERFHNNDGQDLYGDRLYDKLTYIDLGPSNFQRHIENLAKDEKPVMKKPKKLKPIKGKKKMKTNFKNIL